MLFFFFMAFTAGPNLLFPRFLAMSDNWLELSMHAKRKKLQKVSTVGIGQTWYFFIGNSTACLTLHAQKYMRLNILQSEKTYRNTCEKNPRSDNAFKFTIERTVLLLCIGKRWKLLLAYKVQITFGIMHHATVHVRTLFNDFALFSVLLYGTSICIGKGYLST